MVSLTKKRYHFCCVDDFQLSFLCVSSYLKGMDMAHTFAFDHVYSAEASQSEVYENTAQSAVMSVLKAKAHV